MIGALDMFRRALAFTEEIGYNWKFQSGIFSYVTQLILHWQSEVQLAQLLHIMGAICNVACTVK